MPAKFEENLNQLEEIVQELDEGGLDLNASLKAFESGIKLAKSCRTELDKAQQKVDLLIQKEEVDQEIPFEG